MPLAIKFLTLCTLVVLVGSCQSPPSSPVEESLLYEIADGNAAQIYLSLKDRFQDVPEEIPIYMGTGEGDRARIRLAIEAFKNDLSQLERAAQSRSCNWNYPEQRRLAPASHLRIGIAGGRVLAARARLRLEAGETDAGLRDIVVLLRIGSDFLLDTPLFPQLVGIQSLCFAYRVAQETLGNRELTREQLSFLAIHVDRILARYPPFRRAIECERALLLGVVDRYIDDPESLALEIEGRSRRPGEEPGEIWKMIKEILQADPEASRQALRGRIGEYWEDLLFDAEQPLYSTERRVNGDDLNKKGTRRLTEYKVFGDRDKGLAGAADTLVMLGTPALEKAKLRYAIGRLVPTLLLLWCRLGLYRHDRGTYPVTLEELGVKSSDPFDGSPIKYRKLQTPGREAVVLTAAGPKRDWENRIRILAEQSGFDLGLYFRTVGEEADTELEYTLWSIRTR